MQSAIATGHLLREAIYPPQSSGQSAVDRTVIYAYNAQGEQVWTKDQAGNVIQTDFDTAGRETHRRITTLASGFDGAVRRISTTYQTLGRGRLSSLGVDNRKGYAGYEYDPTLEGAGKWLYHVRHRVYDADVGRWTRRDPLGYVDGMSLYEYVRSRPLVATDPRGLVAATCGASCQPSQPVTPSPPATTPQPGEPPAAQPPECPTPTIVVPPNFREPESIKDLARKRCLEYCAEGGLARMFCHDGKPYICVCPANIKKRFPDGGDDFREQYRSCVEAHEKQNWRHHVCDPDNPNADPKENPNHKGKAACNEAEAYRLEVQCARRITCNTKACEDAKSDAIAEAACLQALWMRACRGGPEPTVEEGNACRQRK